MSDHSHSSPVKRNVWENDVWENDCGIVGFGGQSGQEFLVGLNPDRPLTLVVNTERAEKSKRVPSSSQQLSSEPVLPSSNPTPSSPVYFISSLLMQQIFSGSPSPSSPTLSSLSYSHVYSPEEIRAPSRILLPALNFWRKIASLLLSSFLLFQQHSHIPRIFH